ncbi:hypothetical protein FW320_05535 [Azospirillum sp. Vi22]|uniref:hypothetical protein n=1 Tax=Azospirillum baldaniorum TaxID=1064539 RepID=UPI00157B1F73|nr:hypothetical protein [Azospirillum baldaniorum]NUB05640.1 hypothetical protein [Azospirillum baldaniorum]
MTLEDLRNRLRLAGGSLLDFADSFLFGGSPGTKGIYQRYWKAYGGRKAVLGSFYFRASVLLTVAFTSVWLQENWFDLVSGSIPTILGFTIAAFTALLAFSDKGFVDAQIDQGSGGAVAYFLDGGKTKVDLEVTDYIRNFATFVHFIVVQIAAFLLSLLSKASQIMFGETWSIPIFCITFLVFIYAILLSAASTMSVFRMAFMFQVYRGRKLADERRVLRSPSLEN